jgi:type I restriction enzyme R subunit
VKQALEMTRGHKSRAAKLLGVHPNTMTRIIAEIGDETPVELPGFSSPDSFEKFRAKTRQFLREHEDDLVIHKLRMNEALTATDLGELEQMLAASGLAKRSLGNRKAVCVS